MVIFHSYLKLPEGKDFSIEALLTKGWSPAETSATFRGQRVRFVGSPQLHSLGRWREAS